MHHIHACENMRNYLKGDEVAYTTRYFKHSHSVQVFMMGNLEMRLCYGWFMIMFFCGQGTVFEQPLRILSEAQVEEMNLKYYNSEVHKAAFILPQFAKKVS